MHPEIDIKMTSESSSKRWFKKFSIHPVFIILILLTGQLNLVFAQGILIDDNFTSGSKNWKEIKLNGATDGQIKFENQSLSVTNSSGIGAYGLSNLKTVSRNFYAEA